MASLPKAVDRFGPELLSLSWADLGNEKSSFLRKQGGMRALAALSHASMTRKPGGGGIALHSASLPAYGHMYRLSGEHFIPVRPAN